MGRRNTLAVINQRQVDAFTKRDSPRKVFLSQVQLEEHIREHLQQHTRHICTVVVVDALENVK